MLDFAYKLSVVLLHFAQNFMNGGCFTITQGAPSGAMVSFHWYPSKNQVVTNQLNMPLPGREHNLLAEHGIVQIFLCDTVDTNGPTPLFK